MNITYFKLKISIKPDLKLCQIINDLAIAQNLSIKIIFAKLNKKLKDLLSLSIKF